MAGPDFGSPAVTTRCRTPKGGIEVGDFGLFGDAWLSCTLGSRAEEDRADLAERTSRWCAAVVTAAGS